MLDHRQLDDDSLLCEDFVILEDEGLT